MICKRINDTQAVNPSDVSFQKGSRGKSYVTTLTERDDVKTLTQKDDVTTLTQGMT